MDAQTYILSRKYTDSAILGTAGPLKGKPCTISSIVGIEGGKRVTFAWTDNGGSAHTSIMDVMDGEDGAEVTATEIDGQNHLIFTYSDGRTVDAGELPIADDAEEVAYENEKFPELENVKDALDAALQAGAALQEKLVVSNPVGSATNGKTYPAGTSLEKVIRDILIKETAPGLTLTIDPSATLYDKATAVVSSVTMKAAVTKGTYDLSKVEFYLGDVLKHTEEISSNGTYQFTVTMSPTNSNFTLKAVVYDKRTGTPMTTTKSVQVKFVGKSYYGTVDAETGEPTEALIKALQNRVLKDTKNLTYDGITMTYGKVVYAYPAELGNITSIMDIVNNFPYTNSFIKSTVSVDGMTYNCYTQIDPAGADGLKLQFS